MLVWSSPRSKVLTLRDDRLTRGRRLNSLHTLRPTGLIAQGKERKVET